MRNQIVKALYLKKADLVRKVRPIQKDASRLIIEAVLQGVPPTSMEDAIDRFGPSLGESILVDAGSEDAQGDIRHLAIKWLILNGFVKAKAVTYGGGQLSGWTEIVEELEDASALEIVHGSSRPNEKLALKIAKSAIRVGHGPRAVYVYTDSRLDNLGDICTKIGKHHHSGFGDISGRIAAQYGTGNPGNPVLRYIFAVTDESGLETYLHRLFEKRNVDTGVGKEWFTVSPDEVLFEAKKVLTQFSQ